MLCKAMTAVCSEIQIKVINILYCQNVKCLKFKPGGIFSNR